MAEVPMVPERINTAPVLSANRKSAVSMTRERRLDVDGMGDQAPGSKTFSHANVPDIHGFTPDRI